MRVLYFSRGYTAHDHRFLSALADTEHDIHFLQLVQVRQLEDRPLPSAVSRINWRGSDETMAWNEVIRLRGALKGVLQTLKPDLVHAGPVQQTAFITALAGFHPLVTMSWGSDLLMDAHHSRVLRWKTRFTLQRSDILLGDCQAVASEAVSFGFPRDKIVLFPWGVELERFKPGKGDILRQRLGWEDSFVLLSLRAWEPLYGVDHLLKGFVLAAEKNADLRLILLGGGSQAALLRGIIQDAGLLDRVYFGGHINQNDLPRYYQAADLYVSASHSDGSSVSLMEAMASGVPLLVSDIPGNQEWVDDGVHGWFFPDGDEQAIAAGIEKAYRSWPNMEAIRQANRKRAEQKADWSQNAQRMLDAYNFALEMRNYHG